MGAKCVLGLVAVLLILSVFAVQTRAQFCTGNETRKCVDLGACKGAARSCIDGVWGACNATAAPREICGNGIDDDCNGLMDECESPWLLLVGAGVFLLVIMGFLMKMGY
jgi:hypothetical protein